MSATRCCPEELEAFLAQMNVAEPSGQSLRARLFKTGSAAWPTTSSSSAARGVA
jgi:hypothetical protein